MIAGPASSIDEIAPGRFTLGLGTGHSSVEPIGTPPSRGSELRDAVGQVRRLVRGEEVRYGEGRARIRDPRPDGVPILMAATGARNLRLAGEIGDGAILLSGVAEQSLRGWIAQIRADAADAGRDPESVRVTVCCHAMVTDDVERDARSLKPVVAPIAQKGGLASLRAAGIEVEVPDVVPEVSPDLIHAEDWDLAVEVGSRLVSDADAVVFAQCFCLFGSREEIVDRLAVVGRLGVQAVFLQHVGSWDLPPQLVEAVGERATPLLRGR